MNPENIFIGSAKLLKACRLKDAQGNTRTVEPYMVYVSSQGKRLFHCYQLSGFSERGQVVGWKNPEVGLFQLAEILEEFFAVRPGYNPFNSKMFPVVHFSIPTYDGRQR